MYVSMLLSPANMLPRVSRALSQASPPELSISPGDNTPTTAPSARLHSPGTPWGSGAEWCVPPSSGGPAPPSTPRWRSPRHRCPSAAPAGSPGPRPGAGSRRAGRAGPAPAPPRGSTGGHAAAVCGPPRPRGDSYRRSLQREEEEEDEEEEEVRGHIFRAIGTKGGTAIGGFRFRIRLP